MSWEGPMNSKIKKIVSVCVVVVLIFSSLIHVNIFASNDVSISSFNASRNTIDTFLNEQGNAPEMLTFTVQIAVSQTAVGTNYQLEVPFEGFTPDGNEPFQHFSMSEPIFEFAGLTQIQGVNVINSNVISYEDQGKSKSKLLITLDAFTSSGTVQVGFRLKLNDVYLGLIPQNTILWDKPSVNLIDSNTLNNIQTFYLSNSDKSAITSSFVSSFSVLGSKNLPSGTNQTITSVRGNEIKFNLTYRRRNRSYYTIKDGTPIQLVVDMPSSMEFNALTLSKSELSDYEIESIGNDIKRYRFSLPQNHDIYSEITNTTNNGEYYLNNLTAQFVNGVRPDSGTDFKIELSIEYQLFNGALASTKPLLSSNFYVLNYRVEDNQTWNLYYTGEHYNNPVTSNSFVNTSVPDDISLTTSYYGSYSGYSHARGFRNEGMVPIKGVNHYIYQENAPGAKVDFGELGIKIFRKSNTAVRHAFKVKLVVYDAIKNTSREVYMKSNGSDILRTEYVGASLVYNYNIVSTTDSQIQLNANEYIEKVELIPFGDVTNPQEGDLLPDFSLLIFYRAKMWTNLKWPDGSTPNPNEIYPVHIKSATTFINEHPTLDYNDIKTRLDSSSQNAYIEQNKTYDTYGFENNTNTIYYGPGNTTTLNYEVSIQPYEITQLPVIK